MEVKGKEYEKREERGQMSEEMRGEKGCYWSDGGQG